MITQEEYNVTKQTYRELYIKINLLNYKFQTVDELSGVVIGNPTFNVNESSDIRRTCSLSLIHKDSSFDIKEGSKIWMDKYIVVFIGIKDIRTNKIVYTKMGTYILNNPNLNYSAIDNSISIQCVDLMAKLNGTRDGVLTRAFYEIKQGTKIRDAIVGCLKLGKIEKYIIDDDIERLIPYDIKIEVGGTIFNILSKIRDILPNYQMYFDVDGIFHFEKIPSGKNEQIFIDDDIWDKVLINYNKNTDYSTVKNYIEVFGKMHDIQNFGGKAVIDGTDTYSITIKSLVKLQDFTKIGFTIDTVIDNPKLKLNNFGTFPILNEDKTIPTLSLDEYGEEYYVVLFREYEDSTPENVKGYYELLGKLQPHAIAKEENPNSPFYVNGTLGEIEISLNGNDYENIYSDKLAQERANWELYTRCKLKDNINLTCIPIYWADVNKVISITLPNKNQETNETNLYIIKSISTTFGVTGSQSISCMRYYPFYDNYIENK